MDLTSLPVAVLAAVAIGAALYAVFYPALSGSSRAKKRQSALLRPEKREANSVINVNRREQVAASLKEVEHRERERSKLSLQTRLMQAGLDWTKSRYYIVSLFCGTIIGIVLFVASGQPLVGLAGLFVGGLGLPRWFLNFLKKRRLAAFLEEFPNAIDLIVRGIRSGLPVGDCFRMIASDTAEPVKSEFRRLIEAEQLGMGLNEAVGRLHERIPLPEANFFAIVIQIQQKSGGNLAEVLGNLSNVLRDRKKMRGKISAMSMEAKASAAVIGCIPIVLLLMLYLSSPAYVELLWTRRYGQFALLIGGTLMLAGVLVMRKMIKFDI